jgi:dolichol-phosphate mannosyltransferase
MKGTVVIAAYNERENIETLTRRIHDVVTRIADSTWTQLFVVEGEDGTRDVLEGLADELGGISLLYQAKPRGIGDAFRRGFAAVPADTDVVVTMDADLNHQPEEIPRLLEAWERRKLDILIGSRFVRGGVAEGTPYWKLAMSGTLNVVMRIVFGLRVRDKTSGFRVYRGEVLRRIRFRNDDFAFLPEILIRARASGLSMGEEPIHFIFRRQGVSKMRFWQTVSSYVRLFRLRFEL